MGSTPFQGPVDSASWGLPHSLHAHRQGLAPVQGPAAELRHVGPWTSSWGAPRRVTKPLTPRFPTATNTPTKVKQVKA